MEPLGVTIRRKHTFRALKCVCLTLFLASCNTTGGSFCDIADPIRLSAERVDQLSDAEVNEILAHNAKGERLCSWAP